MAITYIDLAIALRVSVDGTDVEVAQRAILTRLIGVGDAHVSLLAPEAIKDKAIIRLAGSLFDVPRAGRRDAYANAFVNSGAGALLSRWSPQAASRSA